ncbi:MAG: dynamin family protein [Bacteroidales bacterium]|nr:dynamin family protein [Bacteroidales bacterium]
MSKTKFYQEVIEKAFSTAKEYLLASALSQAEKEKEELSANLLKENAIKVPLVGSFNAGKSSLINAFLNRNFLPVDIKPETAISYEILYSEAEKVDIFRDDKLIDTKPLDQIKNFDTKPGDIAKVYVSNQVIKDLQMRGITLVDMPGIDSGIEEHNQAIFHYISQGSAFVLLTDVEGGSLTTSNLNFLSEIRQYNLHAAVLVSKTDKKPESEITQVKEYIRYQAKKALETDTFVGCVSAANGNISDLSRFLDTLDCNQIVSEKFGGRIKSFIDLLIMSITTQTDILSKDITDIDEKIKKLEQERANIEFDINNNSGDTPEKSTQDVLDEVAQSLELHAEDIASMIVNKEDATTIQNAIMSYVRPVIINALKEEGEQFADALNTTVDKVSKELAEVATIDTSIFNDIYTEMGLPVIMTAISRVISTLNPVLGRILGTILTFLAQKIPDIIRSFFGKSDEELITEISHKIKTSVIANMTETLRPKVLEMVTAQQERIKLAYKENIEANIRNRQQSLKELHNSDKAQIAQKISAMKDVISQLNNLKSEI